MKNLSILFFLAVLAFTVSCNDDDAPIGPTGSVNLNWTGVYDTDPLVMLNRSYKYPDGKQVNFKDVNFFISNVSLLEAGSGDEVELIEVEYVNFSSSSDEAAKVPIVFKKNLVPVGDYKSLRISFGVPADLNNEDANQFGTDHPLRKNFGQFWSAWGSFIFTMVNGQYDENGDGAFDENDPGFSHHLGSDAVFTTVTFDLPIKVEEGQALDLDLVFDLKKMYARSGSDYFDMTNEETRHTNDPDDLTVADYMMANFQNAISVQ